MEKFYKDKKILITGGLGFIGSNLAHKLVTNGAKVTILDNQDCLYGGNLFNIQTIKNEIELVSGNLQNKKTLEKIVANKDIIFDFAAQVSYVDSCNIPFKDLEVNCRGHLLLLELCRKINPAAKIIFSSSRLVFGESNENKVLKEDHPTNPSSIYGIHKLVVEKYFLFYYKQYGIRTTVLRLTNPYGERQLIKHPKYSIPGWFMRLALENKTIKIFGDGSQLRDYLYINDLTDSFLMAGSTTATDGEIYNCGYGKSVKLKEMAELIIQVTGLGNIEYVDWPNDYKRLETGNCEVDIFKLRSAINWCPNTSLESGLRKMYNYYKVNLSEYV